MKPLARSTEADFVNDFRLNASGVDHAAQLAQPASKAGGDTSAMTPSSSIAASQGFVTHASIAKSRGAVESLKLSLAAELARKAWVNAIAPSLTTTALAFALVRIESVAAAITAAHPLARWGESEDIAELAAFLASPRAFWTTGRIIREGA